jgi:uncharacterized protein YuzE
MKVKYFSDTATMYLKIREGTVVETKELNQSIFIDIDNEGKVLSLTFENIKENTGHLDFSFETIPSETKSQ